MQLPSGRRRLLPDGAPAFGAGLDCPPVPKLTVTVITRNEAANIEAALASVAWADEIVVVDSESTDDTAAIARRTPPGSKSRPWPGYSAQKNYAASLASHDWILSLDADERVTPALAAEISRCSRPSRPHAATACRASATYLGRWIRGTDWYPDYQLRLYDRRAGAMERPPRPRVRAR